MPSSASLVVTVYEYATSSVALVTAVLVIVGASAWSDSTETCVAAVLLLPAASVATPAATLMVIVESEAGVMVAVYVVPLPEIVAEPLLRVMSLATKLLTDSPKVMATENVDPVAGLDPVYAIVADGPVVSTVKAVSVSAEAAFPAESVNVTVQVYAASPLVVSVMVFAPEDIVEVELRPHPDVPPTAIVPASATLMTTSGVVSVVGVEAAVVSVAAAAVKSIVTDPEFAVVSALPALPAASVWLAHEKVAAPAVSDPSSWCVAVHEVPEPPMVAESPAIVQARPDTLSLAVMVRVSVSPLLAKPELLLLVVSAMFESDG